MLREDWLLINEKDQNLELHEWVDSVYLREFLDAATPVGQLVFCVFGLRGRDALAMLEDETARTILEEVTTLGGPDRKRSSAWRVGSPRPPRPLAKAGAAAENVETEGCQVREANLVRRGIRSFAVRTKTVGFAGRL